MFKVNNEDNQNDRQLFQAFFLLFLLLTMNRYMHAGCLPHVMHDSQLSVKL